MLSVNQRKGDDGIKRSPENLDIVYLQDVNGKCFNLYTTTDRNVYEFVAFWCPMKVMLFLRIINTGISKILVQVTVVNVPPVT